MVYNASVKTEKKEEKKTVLAAQTEKEDVNLKIHVFSQPVYISTASATEEAKVQEGQIIPEKATIRTGSTGRAEISYPNQSVTRLNFDTTVHVSTFSPDPQTSVIDLLKGSIWNRVAQLLGKESFSTETGAMVATVRGTAYQTVYE